MRLRHARDFERLLHQPFCRSTDEMITVLARHNDRTIPRLGLAISRKRVGRAVERNLIKRVIRESFRHSRHRLRGLDLLVIGRGGLCRPLDRKRLQASLTRHWQTVSERCADR